MIQSQRNLHTIHGDKPQLVEVLQNLIDDACKFITVSLEYYEGIFYIFVKLNAIGEGRVVEPTLVKGITGFHRIYVNSKWAKVPTSCYIVGTRECSLQT